jgi:2-C-methyl-D-erythritol 2,4-cyclodiphosphate synthase
MMRIGIGYDIHRLEEGEKLILGGVEIPGQLGSVGHSDADALIHAVIDAILGAAGLGDIGEHFPPKDPAYRNISSRILLKRTMAKIREKKYSVANVDTVVILQKPSLLPHKERMRCNIAADLGVPVDVISVKAKTKEGVDAAGEQRAVEVHAAVLLTENPGT